jgi:hypothetical protein
MRLKGLSPARDHPLTETAQRFLAGAFDAVEGVLGTLEVVRQLRQKEIGEARGRLPQSEEDLLRAAVVFAGAGLDASLKQLIRDALPVLLETSDEAHREFETFTTRRVRSAEGTDPSSVARYLAAADARSLLIEDYVLDLTGSSLQSAEEVLRAAKALGLTDRKLHDRIMSLKPVFVARNEISHELDHSGRRSRVTARVGRAPSSRRSISVTRHSRTGRTSRDKVRLARRVHR